MNAVISLFGNPSFWFGVVRSTTPLLLAALAALIAARSGITNMAIEGIMLFSALFAVMASYWSGSAWIGLLVALLIGIGLSLSLAYFKLKMDTDEVLVAIALNLLAEGATIFLLFIFTGEKATSASIGSKILPNINIPLIQDLPFIGKVLSGHSVLVYISFALIFVLNYLLFKTPLGLRIRSVGSNPHAAESVGISVNKTKYIALGISGFLAGMAGAYMSMGYMKFFVRGMVAGRGFVGLAANNVGGRHPIGAFLASALFGVFESLANNLQSIVTIPVEFIQMIPYITTILAYTFFSYRRMTERQRKAKKLATSNN
ncbi:MAG: ABC transporter permease [Tissierellia bacterium]|nr:ABC transporter permease [Tissierellia bacterium]